MLWRYDRYCPEDGKAFDKKLRKAGFNVEKLFPED